MDKPNFKLKRIKKFEKEFLQQSSCPDKECQWTKDRCFHGTEDVMKDFICASMELAYEKAYQDAAKRFRMREQELQDSFRRKVEEMIPKKTSIKKVHEFYKPRLEDKKNGIQNTMAYDYSAGMVNGRNEVIDELRAKLKNI